MKNDEILSQIKYDANGLVPAIVQDYETKQVLMLAYMNKEAIEKTLTTGTTWFYSRSRQSMWNKGETSGHFQKVVSIAADCDGDTLLIRVRQEGAACHTGERSCFFNALIEDREEVCGDKTMSEEFAVIDDRFTNPVEGSYTNYLFDKGVDKIAKKVGEEAAEVIIAAKNRSYDELRYEAADLFYHLMVLLREQGMTLEDIYAEMVSRRH